MLWSMLIVSGDPPEPLVAGRQLVAELVLFEGKAVRRVAMDLVPGGEMKMALEACLRTASRNTSVPLALTVKSVAGSRAAQSCDGCAAVWTTSSSSEASSGTSRVTASESRMSIERCRYRGRSATSVSAIHRVEASGPKKVARMSLSRPTTSHPRAWKWRAVCDPIRPAEPVTSAVLKKGLGAGTAIEDCGRWGVERASKVGWRRARRAPADRRSSSQRRSDHLRIQLLSYNYDPEPTGIAPIAAVWAREMHCRGHSIEVVAAHPHYPHPAWGRAGRPYREVRDGIGVLRLPLLIGRASTAERVRQEASYAASLSVAAPLLDSPDVCVAVSPSFPALLPTLVNARLRRTPLVLWLQDILPDGAQVTGLVSEGALIKAARRLECEAYRSASRIVVLSDSFAANLRAKGVPAEKIVQIYNPATRPVQDAERDQRLIEANLVMTMGNIGRSQGLDDIVAAFGANPELAASQARFVLVGDGVAADEVRARIGTDRIGITGIVREDRLEHELRRAAVALVSQRYEGVEFNVPSKLMNFMGAGVPVVASVRPDSEVARILTSSGGGWVTDSRRPEETVAMLAHVLTEPEELRERGIAGLRFAQRHFTVKAIADEFEGVLRSV